VGYNQYAYLAVYPGMDIEYKSGRLRDECNDILALTKRHGRKRAEAIMARIGQMAAAPALDALFSVPRLHCHELSQNRTGQLAVNVDARWRIIFEPADRPAPTKPDGGLDRALVTAIRVLEVVDYHG